MLDKVFQNINRINPIVHCITNFVTVNDCANIILACGGSPTMAYDFREVADITSKTNALVLNMGTVSDNDAMITAGRRSNELNHPVIIDPVGVGGSRFRVDTFRQLADSMQFSVIRGNISEIKAIATGKSDIRGVDATEADKITENNVYEIAAMAKQLSIKMKSVIVISGPIDIVANKEIAYLVRNGHPIMAKITGSGCMSTAMLGAFCGGNPDDILEASLASTVTMGVCGELAYEKTAAARGGTMTFRLHLIDQVSLVTPEIICEMMRIEKI
ncbi:hydroxyethylthiazole kinase [Anaerotignum sp.]|uniref:hydroxyethylthiazole kinase n=1 Tax=Anaerotignum sp. TaxID=2039241 RepID=UPI00271493B0|nr:hydroxyethylthiazole kinase [Anaerotignum sp.]